MTLDQIKIHNLQDQARAHSEEMQRLTAELVRKSRKIGY